MGSISANAKGFGYLRDLNHVVHEKLSKSSKDVDDLHELLRPIFCNRNALNIKLATADEHRWDDCS